jgi:competence protein ComEC
MRDALLLAGFLGFASGIACRSLLVFSWHYSAFLVLLAALALAAWVVKKRLAYAVAVAAIIGCVLGSGRIMLAPSQLPPSFLPLVGTDVSFEGTVIAEPDVRETTQRVTVEVEKDDAKTKVLVVAPLYPEVRYGDRVRVEGSLELPEPFETDTGRTFRYDRFLAKDGVFAIVSFASIETHAPGSSIGTRIMRTLIESKHAFQGALASAIPEPGASLASGLITGGKQGLGEELLDMFIVAGLVHIVVLSGYNVMIVAEGVLRVLGFLPKRIAAGIAGLVIALFVLAAGAGSASIRAGLMAGLALTARATGRTYAVVRALLAVAFLMLLVNPLLLAYDPGFQLSFLATLGLILLSPVLEVRLAWIRSPFWRDLLAATLAAQIAVLPLLLYQTGLFSVVSLPANLLVLPVVPLAMAFSALAGALSMIVPAAAPLFGFPAHVLLSYVIEVARFSASLPASSFAVPQFPFIVTMLSYGALAFVIAKAPGKPLASRALRA